MHPPFWFSMLESKIGYAHTTGRNNIINIEKSHLIFWRSFSEAITNTYLVGSQTPSSANCISTHYIVLSLSQMISACVYSTNLPPFSPCRHLLYQRKSIASICGSLQHIMLRYQQDQSHLPTLSHFLSSFTYEFSTCFLPGSCMVQLRRQALSIPHPSLHLWSYQIWSWIFGWMLQHLGGLGFISMGSGLHAIKRWLAYDNHDIR